MENYWALVFGFATFVVILFLYELFHRIGLKDREKALNEKYASMVGTSFFWDKDNRKLVGMDKKPLPQLKNVRIDGWLNASGMRYLYCKIEKFRADFGASAVLKAEGWEAKYKIIYRGDFGIIFENEKYGQLFWGVENLFKPEYVVGAEVDVKVTVSKGYGGCFEYDFEVL